MISEGGMLLCKYLKAAALSAIQAACRPSFICYCSTHDSEYNIF